MQPKPTFFFIANMRKRAAFSLLELSIVILIIGILVASIMPVVTQGGMDAKERELKNKMDTIEASLKSYRTINNRLPCPAGRLASSSSVFGVEAATPGTCTGGTPAAVGVITTIPDETVVAGMVPVQTLGLQEEFMFDPWGRAFTYVVDVRITETDAFTNYPVNDVDIGNITITGLTNGASGSVLTTKGVMLLTSHGPNGHGGTLPSGNAFSANSTNTYEWANCFCDAAAAADLAESEDGFYMGISSATTSGAATDFDDTVRYYVRSAFITESDIVTTN